MLRFQTAIASVLGPLLVLPAFLGQGHIATLQDALSGTRRAVEVLKGLEQRLQTEPAAALGLILSATEPASGDEAQRDQRMESLRNEVSLLQMELDALQSPLLAADGAVQSALGVHLPPAAGQPAPQSGITTGFDDALRSLFSEEPDARSTRRENADTRANPSAQPAPAEHSNSAYSADPLRHGITCYRAGRYAEAYELLAPIGDSTALYWQARTLERLERIDEAIQVMERAIAQGGAGFEQRRAETDLEFLRWKKDFMKSLPQAREKSASAGEGKHK